MDHANFLNLIIDDGIEAARQSYAHPKNELKLNGAIAGFEACRGKTPDELAHLLAQANEDAQARYNNQAPDYWYWRCRAAEIEWVCNTLSAALMNMGLAPIVPVTARGMLNAARILNGHQS